MRYEVLHDTGYAYDPTVTSSRQLAHLTPRSTAWQTLEAHALTIEPCPTERADSHDYFGNPVVHFVVDAPHGELTVRAASIVEVTSHAPVLDGAAASWEHARVGDDAPGRGYALETVEYRLASPLAPILPEAFAYASESFAPGRAWLAAVLDLTRRIQRDFAYDPSATTVTTRVCEVFAHRRGVCQDFAHLMLSCLRSLGLPARYVSGYILNHQRPNASLLVGADASHAWVASYSPEFGWVDFDPTNGKLADVEFITLGWGRDFADVTPLRGVVIGSGTQELSVRVRVRPA